MDAINTQVDDSQVEKNYEYLVQLEEEEDFLRNTSSNPRGSRRKLFKIKPSRKITSLSTIFLLLCFIVSFIILASVKNEWSWDYDTVTRERKVNYGKCLGISIGITLLIFIIMLISLYLYSN